MADQEPPETNEENYALLSEATLDMLQNKYYAHNYRSPSRDYDGCTLPKSFAEFWPEIDAFEVYDDDVWITSFPKTGSTWTSEIAWCIANDFDYDGIEAPLPLRVPYLEYCTIFDFRHHVRSDSPMANNPICKSIQLVKEARRPRFIKTHLPWELLPRQIRTFQRMPKIIHVARNPKDTCVAYFHHSSIVEGYQGNFETFWQLFITNKLNYTPYWKNVLSYWTKRNSPNIFYITYEEMKKDLASSLRRFATFFGKTLNDAELERLARHLNYDTVRKINERHFESVTSFLKQFGLCQNEKGHFTRAGIVGNYRAQMCADVIDIFDRWIARHDPHDEFRRDESNRLFFFKK